jgi:hypothetical protein
MTAETQLERLARLALGPIRTAHLVWSHAEIDGWSDACGAEEAERINAAYAANQRAAAQVEQLKLWVALGRDPDAP